MGEATGLQYATNTLTHAKARIDLYLDGAFATPEQRCLVPAPNNAVRPNDVTCRYPVLLYAAQSPTKGIAFPDEIKPSPVASLPDLLLISCVTLLRPPRRWPDR